MHEIKLQLSSTVLISVEWCFLCFQTVYHC